MAHARLVPIAIALVAAGVFVGFFAGIISSSSSAGKAPVPTAATAAMHSGRRMRVAPALLDVSSMWAIGAEARNPLPRRTRLPLVTWTPEASSHLQRHWHAVQFGQGCGRVLYLHPYPWGLTSTFRDFFDVALVSTLTYNRTVLVGHGRRPLCAGGQLWLDCFFEAFSRNCSVGDSAPYLGHIHTMVDDEWRLGDAGPAYRTRSRLPQLVTNSSLFPHRVWDELVSRRLVKYTDPSGAELDPARLRRAKPRLYHAVSLSALRSMMAGIVFRPHAHLEAAASAFLGSRVPPGERCVAAHFRWTDKKADKGIATQLVFSTAHVPAALERIERRTGLSYQCLLVLSDDDDAATQLQGVLGDTYDVIPVSQLREVFRNFSLNYTKYKTRGWQYILRHARRQPALRDQFYGSVMVDMLVAVKGADYLIGVGSSGVSQFIAQHMGAARGVDGNAFAVWQEDLLNLQA